VKTTCWASQIVPINGWFCAAFGGDRPSLGLMYLIRKFTGESARLVAVETQPFGAGIDVKTSKTVERVEFWGTSFNDPGEDYCEFRLFDAQGAQIAKARVEGY
jgi:hypothetical protein